LERDEGKKYVLSEVRNSKSRKREGMFILQSALAGGEYHHGKEQWSNVLFADGHVKYIRNDQP
jgi:prepilin-type processing-associated H-X9-DG protein